MKKGKEGRPFTPIGSYVQFLALVRYLYGMPYRQSEGFTRVLKRFVEDSSEAIPMLIDFCRGNNLKIVSINTLKPSLEDAFVKITGLSPEVMVIEKEHAKKGGKPWLGHGCKL